MVENITLSRPKVVVVAGNRVNTIENEDINPSDELYQWLNEGNEDFYGKYTLSELLNDGVITRCREQMLLALVNLKHPGKMGLKYFEARYSLPYDYLKKMKCELLRKIEYEE